MTVVPLYRKTLRFAPALFQSTEMLMGPAADVVKFVCAQLLPAESTDPFHVCCTDAGRDATPPSTAGVAFGFTATSALWPVVASRSLSVAALPPWPCGDSV